MIEALMVFELRGNNKLVKETTQKLKQINKQPRDQEVIAEEVVASINEDDEDAL